VCYALGITEVDPARMQTLFERFVSRERNEPPDIDVDFEHERREEVIQYLYGKYGRERAALAATVICYRPRSAVRDLGKALGLDAEQVERVAKSLAWWDGGRVLPERLAEAGLDPASPQLERFVRLAGELVGFPRHLSQHVGGFVISRGPLAELVPVENAAMPERTVIQWDKDDLEALGLLKVDVLALGMLSAIRRALEFVGRRMQDIPAEDPAVYAMIQQADTVGVFQIESRAQMSMLPRLRPENFYDLVIEVAIVRPGPIQGGMVHPYLRRRRGLEPFEQRLVQGMLERGYRREFADALYRQILGFGEYGFPESHSASFALLVYVSAWLKHHHPAAFCAALLNSQPMGFYAPAQLVQDARRHGVEVRPPDVCVSAWDCTLEHEALRLGLRMVGGLAQAAAGRIAAARAQAAFGSVEDLAHRAALDRRDLRCLAAGGALAALAGHRRQAHWAAAGVRRDAGVLREAPLREAALLLPPPEEGEDVVADYASLGLTLGRHPLALLRPRLSSLGLMPATALHGREHGSRVRAAGLVTCRQRPDTASGVIFVTLEDETGCVNVVVWRDVAERQRRALLGARLLAVEGRIERDGEVVHLIARRLEDRSALLGRLLAFSRDFH
jgi:error-prone DNA polymerase